jgi:hypothetical protein
MILCCGGDIEIRTETCRPRTIAGSLRRDNPLKAQVTLGNYLPPVGPQMADGRNELQVCEKYLATPRPAR